MRKGFYFVNPDNSYTKFAARFVRKALFSQNPIKPDELQFRADIRVPMKPYAEVVFYYKGVQVFHGIVTDRGTGLDFWDCKAKSMQWLLQWRYIPKYIYHDCTVNGILGQDAPVEQTIALGSIDTATGGKLDDTIYLTLWQAAVGVTATKVVVYVSGDGNVKFGVYANNAGAVGSSIVLMNDSTPVVTGWNVITIPEISFVAGTSYWLAIKSDANIPGYYTTTATTKTKTHTYETDLPTTLTSLTAVTTYRMMAYIMSEFVPIGAFWWLHSIIPNGKWTAHNATTIKLAGAGTKSAFRTYPLYATTNRPDVLTADGCDGVHALTEAANKDAVGANQYFNDEDDKYVRLGAGTYAPNAYLVGAAFWAETKIRLDSIDIGEHTCTTDIDLEGQADKKLSEFQEKAGLEAQFLPKNDGYVHYSLAAEISRGSTTSPIRRYVHGRNATIQITKKPEPDVQIAIGLNGDDPSVAISDWSRIEPQIFKQFDGKGELREELEEKLQAIIDENADSFRAIVPGEEHFLRVGDLVSLYKKAEYFLRIQKIDIYQGLTTLDCGKKLFDAPSKFGELLRPTVEPSAKPIQIKALVDGSGSFTVHAVDVATGAWKCYYEHSFQGADDDTALSQNPFVVVTVGGAAIPPGRIQIESGSLKMDITDYCATSDSTDTENTVVTTFYSATGWTSSKCEIKQYIGRRFIA
jgi:hypothetical protein